MQAKAGDIATLAALLEQCETLRDLGTMHQSDGIAVPAAALSEHIKRMIMGESADEAGDMQALRDSVTVLQTALARGESPMTLHRLLQDELTAATHTAMALGADA